METSELNRDIKRLYKAIKTKLGGDQNEYFAYLEETAKPEFLRLYYADRELSYMNIYSIKAMIAMNSKHRFVALHVFGMNVDPEK